MAQVNEKETVDEVLQEMRGIKEALAKSMGFDLKRILDEARQKQNSGGRKIIAPPARPQAS